MRSQTPLRKTPAAMGDLLLKLVTGKLLSVKSTAFLLGVMERSDEGWAADPTNRLPHRTFISDSQRGDSPRRGAARA
jgi:hypothetical protein